VKNLKEISMLTAWVSISLGKEEIYPLNNLVAPNYLEILT